MEQHFWSMMTIVVAVTLVVGLAAVSTWLIWRYRRRELSSYEPVGVAGPEQELQPLQIPIFYFFGWKYDSVYQVYSFDLKKRCDLVRERNLNSKQLLKLTAYGSH